MATLLPLLASREDYDTLPFEDLPAWLPGLREILGRHGLPADPIEAFADGENPVFDVQGRWVVKLVPFFAAAPARAEMETLEWLTRRSDVPLPRLVASGELDGWAYFVSTRLPGRPLSRCWAEFGPRDRETVTIELGAQLAALHAIPVGDFRPAGVHWPDWHVRRRQAWTRRRDVARLSPRLRESFSAYVESVALDRVPRRPVLLHGDLAPENVLVEARDGAWRVSGLFDFGNAVVGEASFDFTAPTVLLEPGDGAVVRRFLGAYGWEGETMDTLRPKLMAYTLLHPMADLYDCLALLPGAHDAPSWAAVAERFWP